jgi:hypothetical protein
MDKSTEELPNSPHQAILPKGSDNDPGGDTTSDSTTSFKEFYQLVVIVAFTYKLVSSAWRGHFYPTILWAILDIAMYLWMAISEWKPRVMAHHPLAIPGSSV